MKVVLLTLVTFLSITVSAQTHHIVKHDGSEYPVNFIKNENNLIYYTNPESFEQQKISSYAVASLKNLKTAQQEVVSSKVAVATTCDYSKVTVLSQKEQTTGLKEVVTFSGLLNNQKGISSAEQFEQTIRSIRNKAAANGYPFVTVSKKTNGTYEAVAYNY